MRINPSSRDQASVTNKDSQMGDIMIVGSENRNRAGKIWVQFFLLSLGMCIDSLIKVHGDTVVVEISSDGNLATPSFDIPYEGNNDEGNVAVLKKFNRSISS
jgi:hypothetical protein